MTRDEFNTYTLDLQDSGFVVGSSDPKSDFSFYIKKPRIVTRDNNGNVLYSKSVNFSIDDYTNIFDMIEEIIDRVSDSYKFEQVIVYFSYSVPDYWVKFVPDPTQMRDGVTKCFLRKGYNDSVITSGSNNIFDTINFYFTRKIKRFEDV